MKIRSVAVNARRKVVEVTTAKGALTFPFAKLDPAPAENDPIERVVVDRKIASEGFTYVLESGKRGTVHVEQVLEYNRDPDYLRDICLYQLTLEAQKRLAESGLSKREIIRRLGTSATQLYRLPDQTNYGKSIDQLLSLLQVLGCEVKFVVRARTA